ncbi:MAG: hypothetical protein GY951_12375 [Psychromonas sp.]|nr:hypothetical protein [Alteromonadales bacterium]MCP5078836.1 hypothetical protein [Psychromonas sp.]
MNNVFSEEGFVESQVKGYRSPFLSYNSDSFRAVKANYLTYDSSIEEGFQFDQDGTNYVWPYTMDNGSPGNDFQEKYGVRPHLDSIKGVWELPLYAMVTPTDAESAAYGIKAGFQDRLSQKTKWFEGYGKKVTGLDWNIAFEYGMTSDEQLGLLKYNLDKRMEGNRAPFIYGIHSNYYTDPGMQKALASFIDYALTKPEVRIITYIDFVNWMRNPSAL